jgi:hypothetical protein
MSRPPRVVDVVHLGDLRLRVGFSDGLVRDLDFAPALEGFLERLRDQAEFARVSIDQVAGTLCWPGGIDFDPDVLHGEARPASGTGPTLLAERHPDGRPEL